MKNNDNLFKDNFKEGSTDKENLIRVNFQIDKNLFKDFKMKILKEDQSIRSVITGFIQEYIK